jgi:hypothetical protein
MYCRIIVVKVSNSSNFIAIFDALPFFFISVCDNCTLTLLDTLDDMHAEMEHGANHIDRSGIPAPWKELEKYFNQSNVLDERLQVFYDTVGQIENFNETAVEKVGQ